MGFELSMINYAEYIKKVYEKIHENKNYITDLDLATGDGDHWANMDMGFGKIVENINSIENMELSQGMKEIGKTMMSVIGGSSGVLYGSAYLAAAKVLKDVSTLNRESLYEVLKAMLDAIMQRGQAKPGFKTMIDSLYPAVTAYEKALKNNADDKTLCNDVKTAAIDGANETAKMEAVRGRATYQSDKGVGHLDPGAVTMSYQLVCLMETVEKSCNGK